MTMSRNVGTLPMGRLQLSRIARAANPRNQVNALMEGRVNSCMQARPPPAETTRSQWDDCAEGGGRLKRGRLLLLFPQRPQVDSKLLAFLVKVAALKSERLRG